jgi:hypothetical protein
VGLTLTAASMVVFAEADWNPSWCVQAEDRAHRIGQEADVVTVQYLTTAGSLDSHVLQTMVKKMDIADRALDRRQSKEGMPEGKPEPEKAPTAPGRVVIRDRRGHQEEYEITDDRRAAVREALLLLSGQCDGAARKDNVGFNGRDAQSDFVRSLVAAAQSRELTTKEAAWGLRVVRTYHKTQVAHLSDRLFPTEEGAA